MTVNMKHVDVILISSYQSMFALPYITEGTGFEGVVYATEPTLQFARNYIDEMLTHIERSPKIKDASRWKEDHIYKQIPFVLPLDGTHPQSWRQLYNIKQVNSSFAKVKVVGFNEKKDIFGSLEVQPLSSGHTIGSCNWLITTHHEKIGYVSSSSTLTTHPKPIEYTPMKNADLIILTNLSQTQTSNPDASLADLCANISESYLFQLLV